MGRDDARSDLAPADVSGVALRESENGRRRGHYDHSLHVESSLL